MADRASIIPPLVSAFETDQKITVHLEPTSDLSFLGKDDKGNKAEVPTQYDRKGNEPLAKFQHTLRKVLVKYKILTPDESIYCFVASSFCPPPNVLLSDLYESYSKDGKLILRVAKSLVWG